MRGLRVAISRIAQKVQLILGKEQRKEQGQMKRTQQWQGGRGDKLELLERLL
jgi:hypothetical protein